MKLRDLFAIVLLLGVSPALAQVNPGTTPLSGPKGGTGNAFMQFTGPASSVKTYTLPNASDTLAALGQIQTWTGAQSFSDGKLILLGSSSGSSTLKAPSTGGGTATLFAGSDTIMGVATAQSPTNKTITGSTNVLGGVTMTLGSDATGDIYYRNSSGILTRLGIGGSANVLTVSGGLPAWVAATGGGNVSNTGTPTANQIAQWTNSTTVQGANLASLLVEGSGISLSGTTTVTVNQSLTNATLQASPTGSTFSTSNVMMGIGSSCKITPVYSGRVKIEVFGQTTHTVSTAVETIQLRFGTGTGPTAGAAATGTELGSSLSNVEIANAAGNLPFGLGGILTGQATGTQIWFDLSASANAATGTISGLTCAAFEF